MAMNNLCGGRASKSARVPWLLRIKQCCPSARLFAPAAERISWQWSPAPQSELNNKTVVLQLVIDVVLIYCSVPHVAIVPGSRRLGDGKAVAFVHCVEREQQGS